MTQQQNELSPPALARYVGLTCATLRGTIGQLVEHPDAKGFMVAIAFPPATPNLARHDPPLLVHRSHVEPVETGKREAPEGYRLITVPFSGFDGMHEEDLDRELEQFAWDANGNEMDVPFEMLDTLTSGIRWEGVKDDYSRAYVASLAEALQLPLLFESRRGPSVFDAVGPLPDRLYALIPEAALPELFRRVDEEHLRMIVAEELEERSGFIPFYSNDLEDWKAQGPTTWDHNQLGLVLESLASTHFCYYSDWRQAPKQRQRFRYDPDELELMESWRCNGYLERWITDHMSPEALEALDRVFAIREAMEEA
jgi:hypothetical protein